MFSPAQMNADLHRELAVALSAAHRAAFEEADPGDARPDPMLAVPVRLIPFVQAARALRGALARESALRAVLEALLDFADDALVAVDSERRILFANAAARRVLRSRDTFADDPTHLRLADALQDERLEAALRRGYVDAIGPERGLVSRLARAGRYGGRACYVLVLAAH